MNKPVNIILYDGYCMLCSRTMKFILKRDKNKKFKYLPLQSENLEPGIPELTSKNYETVILVMNGTSYFKSDAVFRIIKEIGGFWKSLLIFRILPRRFTDWIYDIIAANRFRIFGRSDTCFIPNTESE